MIEQCVVDPEISRQVAMEIVQQPEVKYPMIGAGLWFAIKLIEKILEIALKIKELFKR